MQSAVEATSIRGASLALLLAFIVVDGMTDSRHPVRDYLPRHDQFDVARQVLLAFPVIGQTAAIDCPLSARGYSGADIFRVQVGERCYCLRRWPAGGLSAARLRELHHFLEHLQQSGIDVIPVPVRSRSAETLVSRGGSCWQLEPWMPGTADFHQSPTDRRLRSVLELLGRVHLVAERYSARVTGQQWFTCAAAAPSPAIQERLAIIAGWTPERIAATLTHVKEEPDDELRELMRELLVLYQAMTPAVHSELRSFLEQPFRLHPCLRDLWHDHVLFQGDTVTGLIDPAATRTENVAADLSRLLGSLLGDDDNRWEQALESYSAVRPLTNGEHRLVRCFDRSGVLLSGLTWIDRRLTGRLSDVEVPRVIPRVQMILGRLRELALRKF